MEYTVTNSSKISLSHYEDKNMKKRWDSMNCCSEISFKYIFPRVRDDYEHGRDLKFD